jgi:hypothetical protein
MANFLRQRRIAVVEPQGSVLAPVLYSLLINDGPEAPGTHLTLFLFLHYWRRNDAIRFVSSPERQDCCASHSVAAVVQARAVQTTLGVVMRHGGHMETLSFDADT